MAKSKAKKAGANPCETNAQNQNTLEDLHQDANLLYKLQVLLYDLCNVSRDKLSEQRLSLTTDVLYISQPYFSEAEAATIRDTVVEIDTGEEEQEGLENTEADGRTSTSTCVMTVEQAIQQRLSGFLEKRKASGDARPCGPHDMFPVYSSVLQIQKSDVMDEKFLSRLRRSGLG